MLNAMGVRRIRLITDNPEKSAQRARAGIEIVEGLTTGSFLTAFNRDDLAAKARHAGHSLAL